MRKVRIAILLIVLTALSGWWGAQYWHGYIFWKGSCDGEKPECKRSTDWQAFFMLPVLKAIGGDISGLNG